MKPDDYARMAEECSRQADAMRPGTERECSDGEGPALSVLCQDGQLGGLSGVAATELAIRSGRWMPTAGSDGSA